MFAEIFSSVLLPLVLIASAAFALGRLMRLDPGPLARTSFYLFNPSLAFVTMASTVVSPGMLGRLALLKILVLAVMIPLAFMLAGRLTLSGPAGSAFALAAGFANSGNFGLSVSEYAFGAAGLALAVICYVTDNVMINSVGVYLAARGRASVRRAFLQMFRNPALYAVPMGLAVRQLSVTVPLPLNRTLEMLSRAAVPTMLVVLGLQLARLPLGSSNRTVIGLASVLRLLVAPSLALLLSIPLGLTGLAQQVGVLQCAVPTAVTASVIADRFDAEPNLVAGAVLVSSVGSLITVTALLSWMS
jgi:predicted permease